MSEFSLLECERKAKNEGFDTATFDLHIGPKIFKCAWLDAHMGLFKKCDMPSGFLSVEDVLKHFPDAMCSNFKAK